MVGILSSSVVYWVKFINNWPPFYVFCIQGIEFTLKERDFIIGFPFDWLNKMRFQREFKMHIVVTYFQVLHL